jgi:zinc metalloprotease ZmpB
MLINNYCGNIHLTDTTRTVDATSATAIVHATLPAQARIIGTKENALLMVWQDDKNNSHLAYRVRLTTENPAGDWQAFVDAQHGDILHMENRFTNSGEVHVQGSGYVYLTDPLSAAKKRYGASGFVDNNDGDTDSLNFYRTNVTLDSLTFEDGVYKLKGPYCEIADLESPVDPQYISTDKDGFKYTRSQQAFEAVNAYYHITKSYQYIQHLGFSSPSLAAVRVDPHGLNGGDNSHYSPNGNWIAFGEGGIDDAEDVDAILHEYAHAIVFNFCPSWGGGESGILGEGYSDYWAASYSRSTKGWATTTYEFNWVYNWNAHNMFQLGRSVNDTRTYPFNTSNVHDAGQIWSSTLMAIWNELGKEVTDKLVLKSLYYLGAGATGVDAAQALLQADRDLFGGQNVSVLIYWLGTVKHFIPANPTASVYEKEAASEFRLAQNYPNPCNPTTNITYNLAGNASVSLRVYNMLGQEVTVLVSDVQSQGTHTVSWNGTNAMGSTVASGTYIYRIDARMQNGEHIVMQKKMTYLR